MRAKHAILPAVGAAAFLLLAGCGPGAGERAGGDTTGGVVRGPAGGGAALTGAGATFPYPIYSKWFDLYRARTEVTINYQSIGSGAGIQQMKAGTVDFGASDAPLTDEQLREMPRRVVHVPTVGGAVVLAYNLPESLRTLRLTPELVAAIYLGAIRSWDDRRIAAVNPEARLPKLPVVPVHRSDGSGTTSIFTTYLSTVSPDWKSRAGAGTSVSWPGGVGGKGNDGVAGLVRQSPGAIGYVELAYARQNRLAVASLRNRAGQFVEPSPAATTAAMEASAAALARDVRTPIVNAPGAASYPISALTFLLVYETSPDPAKGRLLADFIDWAIHDGQAVAEELDYARLPAAVVRLNEATLQRLTGKPAAGAAAVPAEPLAAERSVWRPSL